MPDQKDLSESTYSFADILADLDAGVFEQQASAALKQVAEAVVYHDREVKGKLTITLDIERIADSSQVALAHKLAFIVPTKRGKRSEELTTHTPMYVGRKGLSIIPDTQTNLFTTAEETKHER